jgi:integrase
MGHALAEERDGQNRTLNALRCTCATIELLRGGIHTRSKHIDNLAVVIERHYSKLTAMMATDEFAWSKW